MATILIAEDNQAMRQVMALWLTRSGHEVIEVNDGRDAMTAMDGRAIDLLITDVNMPSVEGPELAIWWRNQKGSNKPILMFSCSSRQEDILERIHGCSARVLPKPFSPSKLVKIVDEMLSAPVAAAEATGAESV